MTLVYVCFVVALFRTKLITYHNRGYHIGYLLKRRAKITVKSRSRGNYELRAFWRERSDNREEDLDRGRAAK